MKFFLVTLLAAALTVATAKADTIQLEPSQGILIPAPVAQAMRLARSAYGVGGASSYSAPSPAPSAYGGGGGGGSSYSAPASAAPAYKPASIPAPPCPKNYLFSCQPSLSPIPCSAPPSHGGGSSYSAPAPAPSSAYGGGSSYSAPAAPPAPSYSAPQGAYSQFIPQYAMPVPVVRELY